MSKCGYYIREEKEHISDVRIVLEKLSRYGIIEDTVSDIFDSAVRTGRIWKSGATYFNSEPDRLDGFWRFFIHVPYDSVSHLFDISEKDIRYLAQQILYTCYDEKGVPQAYTVQEIFVRPFDDDKVILEYLLTRDVKNYSLL